MFSPSLQFTNSKKAMIKTTWIIEKPSSATTVSTMNINLSREKINACPRENLQNKTRHTTIWKSKIYTHSTIGPLRIISPSNNNSYTQINPKLKADLIRRQSEYHTRRGNTIELRKARMDWRIRVVWNCRYLQLSFLQKCIDKDKTDERDDEVPSC